MQPEPITHQTDQYRFSVKLEDGTLLLQLNIRRERHREVVALNKYIFGDLPEKMKTFGSIEEVFKYFKDAENF